MQAKQDNISTGPWESNLRSKVFKESPATLVIHESNHAPLSGTKALAVCLRDQPVQTVKCWMPLCRISTSKGMRTNHRNW